MPSRKIFEVISESAQQIIRHGAPGPPGSLSLAELPPIAVSWGRTSVFKTGAWRNITPHYVKRLPPCRVQCPVGNDIEGWLTAISGGNWSEAVRLLLEEQPLPAVCGRVCYHPCEDACNRGFYDQAVSIRAVERYLGDSAGAEGILPVKRSRKSGRKILVVGSGPAGIAAAWLSARAGHSVDIMDKAPEAGGLLRYGIPAYRLPRRILDLDLRRIQALGVKFRLNEPADGTKGLAALKEGYDAVFLATGADAHRSSGIRGADDNTVIPAIPFLSELARGEAPNIGRKVVIIGGGNSAVDAARCAIRMRAGVTILYRRTRAEMPAYAEEIEAALAEGIEIRYLASPQRIRRTDTGIKILSCQRNVLGKPDVDGRRRPEPVPGSEFDLEVDTVIDAVGEYPDIRALTTFESEQVQLKSINPFGRTELEGFWIGGDFSNRFRTVAHAIADGKRAAADMDAYLGNCPATQSAGLLAKDSPAFSAAGYLFPDANTEYSDSPVVDFSELNQAYFTHLGRNRQRETSPTGRNRDYAEVLKGLSSKRAVREAARCFHCGNCDSCGNCHVFCPDGAVNRDPATLELSFDLDHCKGCGICFSECPRSAIEMKV